MKLVRTELPGVLILEPRVFEDDRGFFYESFNVDVFRRYADEGLPTAFAQDNHSRSSGGVLRGLHYQLRRPQGKLVTCLQGAIFDVPVRDLVASPQLTLTDGTLARLWLSSGPP